MRIDKLITTRVPVEIEISEVTLPSTEEYKRCKKRVPSVNDWWWLRSPGYGTNYAACVFDDGSVDYSGDYVNYDNLSVRPVVVLRLNPESQNFQIGDRFEMAGYTWTMIDDTMALCDKCVGRTYFRRDWEADDSNVYEASDVKKWLESWAREKGIEPKEG